MRFVRFSPEIFPRRVRGDLCLGPARDLGDPFLEGPGRRQGHGTGQALGRCERCLVTFSGASTAPDGRILMFSTWEPVGFLSAGGTQRDA